VKRYNALALLTRKTSSMEVGIWNRLRDSNDKAYIIYFWQ